MSRSTHVGLAALFLCLGGEIFPGVAGAQDRAKTAEAVAFETEHVRLALGADGRALAFSRRDGGSLLADPKGAPFMLIRIGEKWHGAASLAVESKGAEQILEAGFGQVPIKARTIVRRRGQYLEVETIGLEGQGSEAVEQWIFVNLPVNLKANVGGWLNVAWDDAFATAVIALEERTNAGGAPVLRATVHSRLGLAGRKAAVIGCPTPQMLGVIRAIEQEHGLPSPTLGGQWAKTSSEARKSWMITGLTGSGKPEAFAPERVFEAAKSLNVEYVVICLHWWNSTFGHYAIHPKNFPQGIASLKAVADKAHAMGLKLGIHVMTASITKNDAYVTPAPDPRLLKEGEATLAADVSETAKDIPTLESPVSFGTASGYWAYNGTDVQIDDEIICYGGVKGEAPFALTGCKRGAYGTRPAPHRAGAKAQHLTERFGWYVGDPDLSAEIGRNLAEIINQAGLDMVCFDGADVGTTANREINFHRGHQVPLSIFRKARRDILLISNGSTHFGWHLMSRGGEDDAMSRGYKRWVDDHTVHGWGAYHLRNLLPPDFSWVGIFPATPTLTAARPDDVELVCARSLGFDGAIGWGFAACYGGASTVETFLRNGRRDEMSALIRTYEKLRLENYFTSQERLPLQEKGNEWRLLPPDSANARYRTAPVRYLKGPIVRSGVPETASWRIGNDLSPQPLRVRVEALPALAPYGAGENVVVADFGKLELAPGGSPAAQASCRPTGETHPQAGTVARLSCIGPGAEARLPQKLPGNGQPAWAQATAQFPAPLNLTRHRALGLWVKGDGNGEVLNIQVELTPRSYLHFYVPITFTDWRYCEVGEPEGDRIADYYSYEKSASHDLKLDRFAGVTLMILNPPRGKGVELLVGRIEALHEIGGKLEDPKVGVGGAAMALPVALEPGQYAETGDFWGTRDAGVCRVFDPSGNELRRVSLPPPPTVPTGESEVTFASGGAPMARAKVTVMLLGSP